MRSGNLPKKSAVICLIVVASVLTLHSVLVLVLNKGTFTYTHDDPYIHLALAENMGKLHYGINQAEPSAPSSSLLWPLVYVPFMWLPFASILPLLFNAACALGTVWVVAKVLAGSRGDRKRRSVFSVFLTCMLVVLGSYVVPTVFTGMEHSLQILLSIVAVAGGIQIAFFRRAPSWWMLLALVLLPLVRYEGFAVTVPLAALLYLRGFKKHSLISFLTPVLVLIGFSLFLKSLGLGWLPTSVVAKGAEGSSGGGVLFPLLNLKDNLVSREGILLAVLGLSLFFVGLFKEKSSGERLVALTGSAIVALHLLFGCATLDRRYIAYVWAIGLTILACTGFAPFRYLLDTKRIFRALGVTALLCVGLFYMNTYAIAMVPVGCNMIFQQQYQMHRFATEFYKEPVAVNDIGLVSFRNKNYVLDLFGLSSSEVLDARMNGEDIEWMNRVVLNKEIGLAMIYDTWYPIVPHEWDHIATLTRSPLLFSPTTDNAVRFYRTNAGRKRPDLVSLLNQFKRTLPPQAELSIVATQDHLTGVDYP